MFTDAADIFLDLDGTVTDSGEGIVNSAVYALNSFGIEVKDRMPLRAFLGPPLKSSFINVCGFDEEKAELGVVKYREYYTQKGMFENRPYPGIEALLEALQKRGKRVILATSKAEVFARQILDYFHLTSYFTAVCGCELDGRRSEKEEVLRHALETVPGVNRKTAVMVGDRKYDILGAKKNGLRSIGAGYGYAPEGELQAAGADVIVKSVAELSHILLGE